MGRAAVMLGALLRRSTVLLPAGRRGWAEALCAEADDVPAGRARLSWLVGGLWLVAREAEMIRRIGCGTAGVAAGAFLVWLDWHPGSANPAMPINRATMIGVGLMLAVLPWATRPVLGPTADNRVARIVRVGGYLTVYALLLVMVGLSRFAGSRFDHFRAFDQRNWEADMRSGAVLSAVLIVAMVGGYAVAILALTARRTSVAPTTLAAGAGAGLAATTIVYVLMPLGNPRHSGDWLLSAGYATVAVMALPVALCVAGWFAARRIADPRPASPDPGGMVSGPAPDEARRLREGSIAGLCAGGAAALVLGILTITTMLLFPRQVDLEWANPDPTAPHGTAYEVQMSVGDAALKYQAGLLLGPLLGSALGAVGGSLADRRRLVASKP